MPTNTQVLFSYISEWNGWNMALQPSHQRKKHGWSKDFMHMQLTCAYMGSMLHVCIIFDPQQVTVLSKFFDMLQSTLTIATIHHISWAKSQTIPPLQCISAGTASPLSHPPDALLLTVHSGNKPLLHCCFSWLGAPTHSRSNLPLIKLIKLDIGTHVKEQK